MLKVAIACHHRRSRHVYGSPRIQRDLRDEQRRISIRRTARVMRELGLEGIPRRRFRVTTLTGANASLVLIRSAFCLT